VGVNLKRGWPLISIENVYLPYSTNVSRFFSFLKQNVYTSNSHVIHFLIIGAHYVELRVCEMLIFYIYLHFPAKTETFLLPSFSSFLHVVCYVVSGGFLTTKVFHAAPPYRFFDICFSSCM
jgi:hypothetical protein